ncbi:type II toxin-antitoxin system RelB family antitoxin [Igneacidithiobacillus copahuensis]|nr:DUF6290 family protein [Igneacidithiobacillus copahuensis]
MAVIPMCACSKPNGTILQCATAIRQKDEAVTGATMPGAAIRRGWVDDVLWQFSYTCIAFSKRSLNMLAIRLPAEVETRLEALAQATGRTKTFYAREAILEHLDDLEDLYLAEQRLIDIRAGKTQTVPLEEVMKRYDMEG